MPRTRRAHHKSEQEAKRLFYQDIASEGALCQDKGLMKEAEWLSTMFTLLSLL